MGPNDEVAELSCNIDDMTGEELGQACRTLMEEGALDVYCIPLDMKKDRPGTMLSCLCSPQRADEFAALILKHTSSFGVRLSLQKRYILDRRIEEIESPLGTIKLKIGSGYGLEKAKLEYEDLEALARRQGISYREAERRIWAFLEAQGKSPSC